MVARVEYVEREVREDRARSVFHPRVVIRVALSAKGEVHGLGESTQVVEVKRRCDHKTVDKLGKQAGETIPLGGAGLIVAYSHSGAAKVEPAVTRAVQKAIGEAEGNHVQALKDALADAQQKMAERSA